VLSAFAKVINTDADENNAMAGSLAFTESELTISSGSVTATRSAHSIDTEADAASDDLDTIATGSVSDGCDLVIRANNTARTVVVKHNTGNIQLANDTDFSLDDDEKSLTLRLRGSDWHEIARAPALPAASQAEMEADTSTTVAVTPGRFRHAQGAAKAHGNMNGTGTPAFNGTAYNFSSITDNAAGKHKLNFTNNLAAATYSVATSSNNDGSAASENANVAVQTLETDGVTIWTIEIGNTTATFDDRNNTSVVVYGDFA